MIHPHHSTPILLLLTRQETVDPDMHTALLNIIWDCFDHRDLARLSMFYFSKVYLDAGKIAVLYSVMMHRIHWIHCTQDQLTYFGNLV